MTTKKNHLELSSMLRLVEYIRTRLTPAGHLDADDVKIAKAATEKLGIEVTVHNVSRARGAIDIPSNPKAGGRGAQKATSAQLEVLTKRVSQLEVQLASAQASIRDLQVRSAAGPRDLVGRELGTIVAQQRAN